MPIVKGDELSASIAAASIIAKVIRDRLMIKIPGFILNMVLNIIKVMAQKNIF